MTSFCFRIQQAKAGKGDLTPLAVESACAGPLRATRPLPSAASRRQEGRGVRLTPVALFAIQLEDLSIAAEIGFKLGLTSGRGIAMIL